MFNGRTGRFGFLANNRHINRNLTPAVNIKPFFEEFCFDNGPRRFLRAEIRARQEYHPDSDFNIGGFMARALDLGAEKFLRNIKTDTCAVAGFPVSIHCAAMPDILQRLQRLFDNISARRAVNRSHKTDAAIGMFIGRVISIRGNERVAFRCVFFEPVRHDLGLPFHGCLGKVDIILEDFNARATKAHLAAKALIEYVLRGSNHCSSRTGRHHFRHA